MLEEMDGLKDSKYVQTAKQCMSVIIRVGKLLLPYLKGYPEMSLVLRNVAFIGIGLCYFVELVILKQNIEKAFSSSATVKQLLQDTLEYTNTRIQSNHQRFSEIEDMIKMDKMQEFEANSKKNNVLLRRLHVMIRVCKIDISDCMQKMKELYTKIESTITSFSMQLKRYISTAAGFGIRVLVGTIPAMKMIVADTGIAIGGLSDGAKQCDDFIAMKNKCDALLADVKVFEEKLDLHVNVAHVAKHMRYILHSISTYLTCLVIRLMIRAKL